MVGRGSASGTFARKRGRQLRNSASAATLRLPGMWRANISKSKCAAMKNKHLSKCIAVSCLQYPALIRATTAALSQRQSTVQPSHALPQIAAAMTIGRSSFASMSTVFQDVCQEHWNHFFCQNAPHPQLPDASLVMVISGTSFFAAHKRLTPFHASRNVHHHVRSD